MILCSLFSCLGTPISSITPFDIVSEQKDPRIPNQHRVGTIFRFLMRRWYVCTSLCSQKYVLLSCGLILTNFSYLSSGASINLDCAGNTYRLLFFDYGIAVLDESFPYSAFFSAVPTLAHTVAFDGFFYLFPPSTYAAHTPPQAGSRCRANNYWQKGLTTVFPSRFAFSANFAAPPQGWVM